MSKPVKPYGVSYIASAPQELNVGDRVVVINKTDDMYEQYAVVTALDDFYATIQFASGAELQYNPVNLRKLTDFISFEEKDCPDLFADDSDNVKAFKIVLNEMAETYRAKDADYGSAYDDGYRLFGHTQLLSRIYEKFSRVKHLLDGNKPNVAESICDTLTDMAVQAICLRMLLQKNDFDNVD